MPDYQRDPKRVDAAARGSGVVVVMNASHVKTPAHAVTTMGAVYEAGYVAELVKLRAKAPPEKPFVLGVGSVINPAELDAAIEMGFDMIVAPANVMGGHGQGCDFVRVARAAGAFCCPAVFTPTELNYFLERDDGLEPDGLKIFPARSHGPKGLSDLLAPFARPRHKGKIIMPTGAVNFETGPQYREVISKRGFAPVLGMSAPLALVVERGKPGDLDTIRESLQTFRRKMGD